MEHVESMFGECMPSRAGLEVVRGRVRGEGVVGSKTLGLGLWLGEGTFHIRKVRCDCVAGGWAS